MRSASFLLIGNSELFFIISNHWHVEKNHVFFHSSTRLYRFDLWQEMITTRWYEWLELGQKKPRGQTTAYGRRASLPPQRRWATGRFRPGLQKWNFGFPTSTLVSQHLRTFAKFWKARSRPYRSRFLQLNIYNICVLSHCSKLNNLANIWGKKPSDFGGISARVCKHLQLDVKWKLSFS